MEIVNWPIVTGCSRITEGCNSCPSYWEYKEKGLDYSPRGNIGELYIPFHNKTPTTYVVALGSDLFQPDIPLELYDAVFEEMNKADWHTFQIVTKRTNMVLTLKDRFKWTSNIWLGAAVESAKYVYRIGDIRQVSAAFRFVSMTSLMGPIHNLNLDGIDYVGVIPETWGYKRPTKQEWVDLIKRQCEEQGVAFSQESRIYENGEAVKWQEDSR